MHTPRRVDRRGDWALVLSAASVYFFAGFAYPLAAGESVFHTAYRRWFGESPPKA